MDELKQWLSQAGNERTFEAGYALFERYATAHLKRRYGGYLAQKQDMQMLTGRLQFLVSSGLAANAVPAEEKHSNNRKVSDQTAADGQASPDKLPAELLPVYARIKELVPPMAALHEQISNESLTIEERKELAAELCAMDDEKQALWKKINSWKDGHSEPPPPDVPKAVLTIEQTANQITRLKANIARTQRKLDKGEYETEATKNKALQNLQRDRAELSKLTGNEQQV